MKVIQVNQTRKPRASKDVLALQKSVLDIIGELKKKKIRNRKLLVQKKELTVVFLSSSQIQKINFQFRKKNKPTDILSFTTQDKNSIGELLICLDVLKSQAKRQKHSLAAETTYMLIHGLLHLLGYDHETSLKEEALMFKIQDQCFTNLGLV